MLCGDNKAKKIAKLIDFGLCEKVESENELSSSWCGSHDYVARKFDLEISSNLPQLKFCKEFHFLELRLMCGLLELCCTLCSTENSLSHSKLDQRPSSTVNLTQASILLITD